MKIKDVNGFFFPFIFFWCMESIDWNILRRFAQFSYTDFECFGLCLSYSSLDSEFLASTSTDGAARIWKMEDCVPLTTLTRNSVWLIHLNF